MSDYCAAVNDLPLVLAGPILRRVEATSVTVWVALRQAQTVTLTVFETGGAGEEILWQYTQRTVRLAESMHVVAVTASGGRANREGMPPLKPGVIYGYDLAFGSPEGDVAEAASRRSLQDALVSEAFPEVSVSYFDHGYPTFSLPPADLSQLRLFQGSCRQMDDLSPDALPILDLAIADTAHLPNGRPHQLFMTGDQIYGDDMTEAMLWAVQANCDRLFDWTDALELPPQASSEKLQPGNRRPLAENTAGFTAALKNSPEKARNHLFRFQEYCVSYLLAWSQCCWDLDFPSARDRALTGKAAQQWTKAVEKLHQLR